VNLMFAKPDATEYEIEQALAPRRSGR